MTTVVFYSIHMKGEKIGDFMIQILVAIKKGMYKPSKVISSVDPDF